MTQLSALPAVLATYPGQFPTRVKKCDKENFTGFKKCTVQIRRGAVQQTSISVMSIEHTASAFPRHESLARFFRTPPEALVPLSEVAALLGTTIPALQAILQADGVHDPDGPIPWTEAAAYLFDAWPRAQVLDALGSEAAGIVPPGFMLMRVAWSLPIFLVRAIEHQAAAASRSRGVDDYVADLLYNDISPVTLDAFRHDDAFMEAFHYPLLD
jgi:hypothetical protein